MINGTKITGLWKHVDKNGREFFSGSISPTARFVIFPNGYKTKETDPDYYAYVIPSEPKEQQADGGDEAKTVRPATTKSPAERAGGGKRVA